MKKYRDILQKTGISVTRVAKRMGMGESHLRYYLALKDADPVVEKKLIKALKSIVSELTRVVAPELPKRRNVCAD